MEPVPPSAVAVCIVGVFSPGAARMAMTCCTCLVTGSLPPRANWNVMVRRTARGGPCGVTRSGPGVVPSQELVQLESSDPSPVQNSNVMAVTSSDSSTDSGEVVSISMFVLTSGSVTHSRSRRHSPCPGTNQ